MMPRITPVDWRTLIKVFLLHGCEYKRKQGSHHVLTCPDARRAIVIPEYDEIDAEIIKNNLRSAGISRDEYFDLLRRV
jgi:predicted RNA binding protein YcfA (HicA-like mRNA interferase family)